MLFNRLNRLNLPLQDDEDVDPNDPNNPNQQGDKNAQVGTNVIPSNPLQPANPLARLAQSNGQQQPQPTSGQNPNVLSFPNRLSSIANQTPMMDKYGQLLNSGFPNPENYQPGKLGRLAAVAGGLGAGLRDPLKGVQTAHSILNEPYDKAVLQYGNKAKVLGEAASVEEKSITNKRLAENEAQKNLLNANKEASEENLRNAQQAYYAARTIALTHPDWKIAKAGGQVIMVNPQDPSQKSILGDANILSASALQQQVDKFRQENGIKVKGEEQLEGVKEGNRKANLKITEEGKNNRAKARLNATGNKAPSATQYRTARSQALQEVLGDPQFAGKFSKIVNKPTDTTPYYTVKALEDTKDPGDLQAHSELIKAIGNRVRQIIGRTPGDIDLSKNDTENDNGDDFTVEEEDK